MTTLEVRLHGRGEPLVLGRLAAVRNGIYFEFSAQALAAGIDPSPMKLPVSPGAKAGPAAPFGGLHGLFNDSLPDGFGALLVDRWIQRQGSDPRAATPLERLAIIGARAMGALTYHPESAPAQEDIRWDLGAAEAEIQRVVEGKSSKVLAELMLTGGSPQGARPKLLVALSRDGSIAISGPTEAPSGYTHSIVKFPVEQRDDTDCRLEEAFARMARAAGLRVPGTRLIELGNGRVAFAAERFDRVGNACVHMHSVSGLLEIDHRVPSLDYESLLRLARALTRSQAQVERMFHLCVFNVLSHNRDDHAKNFAFLQDRELGWTAAPAFDLTYSAGPGGEHTTTVLGAGKDITPATLEDLANRASIPLARARDLIERTREAISRFQRFAREADVPTRAAATVNKALNPAGKRPTPRRG